jgi:hypothetical protein
VDLRAAMEKRKTWFFETQLRRLNLDKFREIEPVGLPQDAPFLDLISDPSSGSSVPLPFGARLKQEPGPAYLDSEQLVWNKEERDRRAALGGILIGRVGNWLDFGEPTRLKAAVAALRETYEGTGFASATECPDPLAAFPRRPPSLEQGEWFPGADEATGPAISRAELAAAKPWLIPELYNQRHPDVTVRANLVANLEQFTDEFERELQLAVGGVHNYDLPFDRDAPGLYRALIAFMLDARADRPISKEVKVRILEKRATWGYTPSLKTSGWPMGPVAAFPHTERAKYWMGVFHDPLRECVALKADSDMGLCQLVRMLYRYGTLRPGLGADKDLTWRARSAPSATFDRFFAGIAEEGAVVDDPDLRQRLLDGAAKLRIVLEETAKRPRSAAPAFSVLTEEILKQGLMSYKFWLDEPPWAKDNGLLNAVKADLGKGDANAEMEYWSENHYVMFASSEYLLGQLWEDEEFQPGKVFLPAGDRSGVRTGAERRTRGRARVLKWLNNRLMFGWMEFNSAGYYREHLWALLNLVDFALDEEVQTKATMAVDLLLFDVVRYLHKGSMGAPGGRSQFKGKNSGWDNALGDVVEIMLGTRGLFGERSSQIGASFATSTYEVPEVLLEIGAAPPAFAFTDRSRVSITFEEAPKYGIDWSLKSEAKESTIAAYAAKRSRHYPWLEAVNAEITRTHDGYGRAEDDTVFFWGMSAYQNKHVINDTVRVVDTFGLGESKIFGNFIAWVVEDAVPVTDRLDDVLIFGGAGAAAGGAAGGPVGAAAGFAVGGLVGLFESLLTDEDPRAEAADTWSAYLEGSIRTRANILSYRTPEVMLASIQNFRVGQLNFQTNVNQATLNTSTNVFTTAGFAGFDLSSIGIGLAIVSAIFRGENPLGGDGDGPGWWTGYWALPMVVQHASAAILAYDFNETQRFLADVGSHAWFPKSGFDQIRERRTSAYDDADFPLLDIVDIGPKGFWLFGKIVHPVPAGSPPGEAGEAYIGVFSNQRPRWLDQGSEPYCDRVEEVSAGEIEKRGEAIEEKLEELEKAGVGEAGRLEIYEAVVLAVEAHRRGDGKHHIWADDVMRELDAAGKPLIIKHREAAKAIAFLCMQRADLIRTWRKPFPDLFAGRDWYVGGKNVWILQVGDKAEFGSFDSFVERVSAARIHLDDTGDMECTYDIPRAGGSSDRLRLAYDDGENKFSLGAGRFATDLYPRFENPFVRGGVVEWGQREYCLEWNGKSLLHDYGNPSKALREEAPQDGPDAAETIKALAIFFRTTDEEMEAFSVAIATVDVGCSRLTTDQVVAAGPVGEKTQHDCEWIFLDAPAKRSPEMTLTISHPSSKEEDEPEWNATFRLRALMGDHTVRDCVLPVQGVSFEDERRSNGPIPFAVTLSRWSAWAEIAGAVTPASSLLARADAFAPRHDLFVLDVERRLWHKRLGCGNILGAWVRVEGGPDWSKPFSWDAVSDPRGLPGLFVLSQGRLLASRGDGAGRWAGPWIDLAPTLEDPSPKPVPLGPGSTVTATPSTGVFPGIGADLYLTGSDGELYVHSEWRPPQPGGWGRIKTASRLTLAPGVPVQVAGARLVALAADGVLWTRRRDALPFLSGAWRALAGPGFPVTRFAVAGAEDQFLTQSEGRMYLAARGGSGEIRVGVMSADGVGWTQIGAADGWRPAPASDLTWVSPGPERWWLFACGVDGSVRSLTCVDGVPSADGWQPIGMAATAMTVSPSAALATVSRSPGQIEVFAQTAKGVAWTWWS